MAEDRLIKVTNRDSGTVGYQIPEKNINRQFSMGETKMIPLSELKQLQFVPGGDFTLKNLLIIEDKALLDEDLNIETEPEYFYTEQDVRDLLEKGSIEQLEDALDFAPEGVIELIKKIAVDTELFDTRKREVISKHTNFNIDTAININKMMEEDTEVENDAAAAGKQRRATPINEKESKPEAPKRRTAAKEYKVVSK